MPEPLEHAGLANGDGGRPEKGAPTPPPPPKRRRHWRRRLVLIAASLLALLLLLVAAAPLALSTSAGRGLVVSLANARLAGTIDVRSLSLAWFGQNELRDLRVLDPQGREVLHVARVSLSRSLLGLATGPYTLGEAAIDSPRATLYVDAHNGISLVQALRFKGAAPPPREPEGGPPPALRGKLRLRDGAVKIVRPGGETLELARIGVQAEIDTLNDLAASLELALADGGALAAEAHIQDLFRDGRLDVERAEGELKLETRGPADLAKITAALAPDAAVAGAVDLSIHARAAGGDVDADVRAGVTGLIARRAEGASPLNVNVTGRVRQQGGSYSTNADLTGDAGTIQLAATVRPSQAAITVGIDRVLAAILNGEPLDAPDFTLEAAGALHLVKLDRALPGLLPLREGQRLTAGELRIERVAVRGGNQPAASGVVELRDVAGVQDGQPIRLERIGLSVDAALEAGRGVQVRRAEVKASFARLEAAGDTSTLRASFEADLTRLHRELGQFMDLSAVQLDGQMRGSLDVKRGDAERVDASLSASGSDIRITSGERTFVLARGTLEGRGGLRMLAGKPTQVELAKADLNLDDRVQLAAGGSFDLATQGFSATVELTRGDLGYAAERAAAIGVPELARYGGSLALTARAERRAAGEPIQGDGSLSASHLTADGASLIDGGAQLGWSGVSFAPDGKTTAVASASLVSDAARIDASTIRWRAGAQIDASADVRASADLAKVLAAVARVAKLDSPPRIGGKLSLELKAASEGGLVSLTGAGGVDDLAIGAGEQTVREKRVEMAIGATLDSKTDRLQLERASVRSGPLTADASGTVEKLSSDAVLALQCRYDARWKELTTLLHELAPDTVEVVAIGGRSEAGFEIRGPLRTVGARPEFRGVVTEIPISCGTAQLLGVELGAASLKPALRGGRLTLPPTSIAAAEGKINLAGELDLAPDDPTLIISGELKLLDGVKVTPLLGSSLLSRINPIFLHMTEVEGSVILNVANVRAPLGEALHRQGAGAGRLDLRNVKMRPGGLLAELLELGGLGTSEKYTVEFGKLDFRLRDGRVEYQDFRVKFPQSFDLRFSGSVGLDDTLDLLVSIPVRPALLKRLGVSESTLQFLKNFEKARIEVPLAGTREQPRIDLSKVNVEKLVRDLLAPDSPQDTLNNILRGLQGGRKPEPKPERPARPQTRPAPGKKPRRP